MHTTEGNLVSMGLEGYFDIIAHGANCFNTMGAGIAKEIRERIPEAWDVDQLTTKGDIKKLGNITVANKIIEGTVLRIINCYSQYRYGRNHLDGDEKPIDYEALTLCLRKINALYPGLSIGLPQIGCGLAGGDWNIVEKMIEKELKDMVVTIVVLPENK